MEEYLDRAHGNCQLQRREVANLVQKGLCMFHGKRYELRAWVIMPNHVHVLFKTDSFPMSKIVGDWKKHTGRLANQLLGKNGAFWARDYFDTFIRDPEHEQRTIRHIENNPTKARLMLDPKKWAFGSAHFRDKLGTLSLPPKS